MTKPASYRDELYRNYFETQAGRIGGGDLGTRLRHEHRELRAEVVPHLPADRAAPILEIGCGWGPLLKLLSELGYSDVEGIDLSAEQVAKAHELGITHARQGDALACLEAHEGHYQVIAALDVLEHFGRDELVHLLGRVRLALRPGGIAIFRTPNADAPFASTTVFGDFTHETTLNSGSAAQLMQACGFADVSVHPSHVSLDHPLKEALRRITWRAVVAASMVTQFAQGRSVRRLVLTPNLLFCGIRR